MTVKNTLLILCAISFMSSCKSQSQGSDRNQERGTPPSIDEIFKMDVNEDGMLSKEEVKGRLAKYFVKIDTNEDGFISRKELEDAPKPPKGQGPPKGQ